ncbi:putative DNA modification/repair radical SAM protein [Fusibacter sp. JL216-2]|uniref:putative DNA modification/repair radical SAM protein n=1 Tax=Fusibacter sp. JL216-2 TaxID=3071453 RepID=UPI003D34BC17
MNLNKKIEILAESAKYDVSCSSSGSDRASKDGMLGNTALPGICHSWSEDGRCISLLKILLSNDCVYDCAYCVNRRSNDFERASFTPDELAEITMNFYRRNYIEGLFLSSAVLESPDHTMELMLSLVKRLRLVDRYNGYIHMKAIPGADMRLIEEAGKYVDRMSVNMELPTKSGLKLLAPQKKQNQIVEPMQFIRDRIIENKHDGPYSQKMRRLSGRKTLGSQQIETYSGGLEPFVPAGQTTQVMIGATNDTDYSIIRLSEAMYDKLLMKRVYYSAYIPIVQNNSLLPTKVETPLLREHRLYQADWLLRFYGFNATELLTKEEPNFDPLLDPKCNWAIRNLHLFPVEVNKADISFLLRVPGIGPTSARRIVKSRKFAWLSFEDLKKMGVVLKRAKYFILCKGRYYGQVDMEQTKIRNILAGSDPDSKKHHLNQVRLDKLYPDAFNGVELS